MIRKMHWTEIINTRRWRHLFNPLSVENVTSPFLGGKRILLEKGYNAVG